jgi:hypothetical protein
MKIINLILCFYFFLSSCKEQKFETNEFVGVWKSDDNATITLNQDGTCNLSGVNNSIISIARNEKEKLNTNGTWKIVNNINSGITGSFNTGIKISYELMNRKGKGGIDFYISGQGVNEQNKPWDLFVWKGDPDEMLKYKFVKLK